MLFHQWYQCFRLLLLRRKVSRAGGRLRMARNNGTLSGRRPPGCPLNHAAWAMRFPGGPSTGAPVMHQRSARGQLADMIGGFYMAQAIYVVAKLGIAERLRDGPQNAAQLARATGAHAGSLHRLLRTLAGFGVFAEDGDGRF